MVLIPPTTSQTTFTVPNDTNAFIINSFNRFGYYLDGTGMHSNRILIFGPNEILTITPSNYFDKIILSKSYVIPVMIYKNSPFIVPAGKKLCLIKGGKYSGSGECIYRINNNVNTWNYNNIGYEANDIEFFPSGTIITLLDYPQQNNCNGFLNGYLFD